MASGVETYVKVKGRCMYLYRAVDSRGRTIDFLLSAKRDTAAAKRFFRKALMQPRTLNPRTIALDKNAAYPKTAAELKKGGELWRWSRLPSCAGCNLAGHRNGSRVRSSSWSCNLRSWRAVRRRMSRAPRSANPRCQSRCAQSKA
jgi:IS6 family transposase